MTQLCLADLAETLKLTPAMQYAKKLSMIWVYESLTASGGGAVIAGLDTTTGRALAVQVNDPAFLNKVRADVDRLRRLLGIADHQPDWTTESPDFQVWPIARAGCLLLPTTTTIATPVCHRAEPSHVADTGWAHRRCNLINCDACCTCRKQLTACAMPRCTTLRPRLSATSPFWRRCRRTVVPSCSQGTTPASSGSSALLLRCFLGVAWIDVVAATCKHTSRSSMSDSFCAPAVLLLCSCCAPAVLLLCLGCQCRIRYRVRQIRELMAVWEGWQRFNQPAGFQPPAWDEADVFNNVLPWTAASAAQGLTEQHMRYKVFCIAQELQRCEEELRFLPQDALNTLQYLTHQQQVLGAALAAMHAAQQQAVGAAEQAMCEGRSHALRAWQARITSMQRRAAQAFREAGWIA